MDENKNTKGDLFQETDNDPDMKDSAKSEADDMDQADTDDIPGHEIEPDENKEIFDETDSDVDWENRVLCSDGSCIGVIGPDGRCKECGKLYEGDETIFQEDKQTMPDQFQEDEETATASEESVSDSQDEPVEIKDEPFAEIDPDEESDGDDDWDNRVLCSDGNCIGVIGPDGRCKECGKPYEE